MNHSSIIPARNLSSRIRSSNRYAARRLARQARLGRRSDRSLRLESLEPRLLLAVYDGILPSVGADLRSLRAEYLTHLDEGGDSSAFSPSGAPNYWIQHGAVYSTVRTSGDLSSVLAMIVNAGFEVAATSERGGVIEGFLPLGSLDTIAAASGVVSVMPVTIVQPTDGQGTVFNEAETVLLADVVKGLFNVDGSGVTVGVISDSADRVGGGLADSVATGNLPAAIPIYLPGPVDGSDGGRAMLELIYDIAPGAALAFASGIGGDAAMAAAIDILVANGATIVVDDLNGLTTEPFFEDGLAAQSVSAAVAAGVTYFSAAGDRGTSGYEAPLNLKPYDTDPFPNIPTIGAGTYHDWNGTDDLTQTITLAPGVTTIVFQYDEPFGAVTSDLDVYLLNAAGTQILDVALEFNPSTGEPREFLSYNNTTGSPIVAQMVIQQFTGASPTRFKWIGFNAPVVGEHLGVPGALNNPHNPGHSGTADAISVAAAWWQTPETIQSSSSRGPVTRSLDTVGNAIPLQIIDTPVITSVDGTSTSVPGYASFFGTSAAAPNAAAVAALLKSFDASLTPLDIRDALTGSAIDLAAPGFDFESGAGLIQSLDAMLLVTGGVLPLVGDRDVVNQDDSFVLTVNSLDNSVVDVSLNGTFLGSVAMAKLTKITVDGRGGSDTLIVDQSQGLITVPIEYEGGFGTSDRLVHTGDPGVPMQGRYTTAPGSATGHAGVLSYNDGAVHISFTGLEPVEDLVPAVSLTIDDTIDANIINVVDGPLSSVPDPLTAAAETTYEVNFAGLAESIQFRNKDVVTVNALAGNDVLTVNVGPRSTADSLTHMVLNGDAGADTVNVIQSRIGLAAGSVFTALVIQGGSDADTITIVPSSAGDNERVTNAVTVDGNSGDDTLIVDDSASTAPSKTVTITATTIAGITGPGAPITYQNLHGGRLEVSLNDAGHTVHVLSTAAGLAETELNTGGGDDTINIDDQPGDPAAGTADGVVSPIALHAQGGADTLQIMDLSDASDNQYHMDDSAIGGGSFGAAVVPGGVFGPGGILFYNADLEAIDVSAGNGVNEFHIDATGVGGVAPTARVTITDGSNGSVFHIQADQLAAGAAHTFNGDAAPDEFNVYVAAGGVVTGASVQINGQAEDDNTSSRDFVRVVDEGGARTIAMTYQSTLSGDLVIDIDGGTPLDVRTTEQVLFVGDAANDDVATIFGTTGDDTLTVAPLSASAALVFLNGRPWGGPADADPFTASYPGIAGGGAGPDILVQGLARTGLTVDGNGAAAGDRLTVYAPSEAPLFDPATAISPFDLLGIGVIIPGLGAGHAYDAITVSDALVVIDNGTLGSLLDVNINTASFVQIADDKVPGLTVNAGFETLPAGTGVADDIVALLSDQLAIRVNGGDPVPATAPQGDRLAVVTPGEINVFSNKANPPEVTITTTNPVSGQTSKELSWSSIENVVLTPGLTSQTVNLIGDNDDPEIDQDDHFVVVGADVDSLLPALATLAQNAAYNPTGVPVDPRFETDTDGANEFYLWINGSAPIGFRNVVFLNVFGDDRNPPPGTPSAGPNDIDTLEITPYADNTPTGWGIDVRFDEGNPVQADGDSADLLIYHTAWHVGVSEQIVIQPSSPENGELRVTNAAFGTPIVTISYVNNLDIIVIDDDGDLSDTDALTLGGTHPDNPGTSGRDHVVADLSAAGDVANPLVVVADASPINALQPILYRLRDMQGFDTVTIDTLGGLDTVSVIGRDDASLLVRVVHGNTVVLPGVADAGDEFEIFPGAATDAGYALVTRSGATAASRIEYVGTTGVVVNGGGGSAADQVAVHGTGARNVFTLRGTEPLGGTVSLDASPLVSLSELGAAGSSVLLAGYGGDDDFSVGYLHGWQVGTVQILGGANSSGDQVLYHGTTGTDIVTFAPAAADTAVLSEVASATLVLVQEVESVVIDGHGGNDVLNVATAVGDHTIALTPGERADAGRVQVDTLVPMSFANLGAGGLLVAVDSDGGDADTLVYEGTSGTDAFTVANATIFLNARIPVSTVGIEAYTLRGLGGDDSFTILSQLGIDMLVQGDEPSGSDTLNYARDAAGSLPVLLRLDADKNGVPFVQTIQQVGYGVVTHTGVEHVNMDVEDGELYVSGTRGEDVIHFTPLSPDSGVLTAAYIPTTYYIDDVPPANPLVITGGAPGRGGPTSGGFADKVVYHGTNGSDAIRVDAPNRNVSLAILGFGYPPPVIEQWRSIQLDDGTTELGEPGVIEVLEVQAHDGSDTITVVPAENVGNGLFVNVDGGAPRASDALVISDLDGDGNPIPLGASDFVVVGQSRVPDAGNVIVYQGGVRRPGIAYDNVEIVAPLVASGDNLLILGPDLYEQNEYVQTATYLGAGATIHVQNLAIFPNSSEHPGVPADQDYFRVVAAQTGLLDFQVYFHMFDPALFPAGGDLSIEVLDATGAVIAGAGSFGNHDTTPNARVRIPAVAGQSYYLHVFGATADVINGYDMTILNTVLPVPYDIELVDLPVDPDYDGSQDPPADNSDTGRSHFDNVTMDASPSIIVRLDDGIFRHDLPGNPTDGAPPDELIVIPFNASTDPASTVPGFRVAIYVEGAPQQPGVGPQTVIGYAQPGPIEGVYVFDFNDTIVPDAVVLADGSHFISARVEITDPATDAQHGYGDRSAALEIVVDTVPPVIAFLGVIDEERCPFAPENLTNDTTPTFYGFAEANSIVRFYLDLNGNGTIELDEDLLLGLTVALPTDGNNQFPEGYFEFTTPVDLFSPALGLAPEDPRVVLVTAEDLAGNVSPADEVAYSIFIDGQGPQITQVFVTSDPDYDLFDPKPSTDGPTPLVHSLTIEVQDFPNRLAPDFLYPALVESIAEHPGHYLLVGDANGIIAIESITFVSAPIVSGEPARGSIILTFPVPLPDDRFTLTISDALIDPACNHLDGETNAIEPQENPLFPTGDGVPGGDFVARFTVDSRPEIGVWGAGNVWVDTNGNFRFDPDNLDATNRDIIYQLGYTSDNIFAGNFVVLPGGVADGFDKLAAYGKVGSAWRWLIDTDNNGVADIEQFEPLNINGLPVAGDFDGNAANGDEVGVFTGTTWYFDRDHDFLLDADTALVTSMRGYPIVGDFDGDGFDDLATYADDVFQVDLANGVVRGWDGVPDHTFQFGYIGVRARPVAADMDMDGFTDFGLWLPDRTGQLPREIGEWNFLVSGGASVLDRIEVDPISGHPRVPFTPVPFGNDMYAQFGDDFALPIVGNFDPPVTTRSGQPATSAHTNLEQPLDVNGDGFISPIDALIPINYLNSLGSVQLQGAASSAPYLDVNMDGFISPIDPLMVINHLNQGSIVAEGEGEGEPLFSFSASEGLSSGLVTATALGDVATARDSSWLLVAGTGTSLPALALPVLTEVPNAEGVVPGYALSIGYLPVAGSLAVENLPDVDLGNRVAAVLGSVFGYDGLEDALDQLAGNTAAEHVAAVDAFFRHEA